MNDPAQTDPDDFHRDRRVWFLSWLLVSGFKDLSRTIRRASRDEHITSDGLNLALNEVARRFEGWAITARRLNR